MRQRLHLDILSQPGTCRHRRPDGSCCGAPLDTKGSHAIGCSIGGWVVKRHNAIVDAVANWVVSYCDCTVFKEQVMPNASEGHNEARMDLIVHSPHVAGGLHIDITVVSALSVEALAKGSALHDGVAANLATSRKERKYAGCEVYAFPIEAHGRIGSTASTVIRMLAPQSSSERSRAISAIYQDIASILQRWNADSMLATIG